MADTRLNEMAPEVEYVVQYSGDGGAFADCPGVDTFDTEAQAIERAVDLARHYGQPERYAWRVVRRITDACYPRCKGHRIMADTRLNEMAPEVEYVVQYSGDGGAFADYPGIDTFDTEPQAMERAVDLARHYGQPERYAWRVVRRITDAYVPVVLLNATEGVQK